MSVFPSTALITDVLNLIKNNTPFLALYTSSPNAGGGGTEVSGGSYARKAVTFGTISGGQMANTSAVTFSGLPSGSGGSQLIVTHFGILTSLTGSTLKVYGAINTQAVVVTGDQIQFPVGSIVINLSGS